MGRAITEAVRGAAARLSETAAATPAPVATSAEPAGDSVAAVSDVTETGVEG
ncbi:hypothetical protein [Modestobacter excelsi]|uniref:hypothetical protein n=1 Tax=Modestobacter excelsi TaxID=2213161 RepID=UPI001C20EC08|nr:hypothetical protein [Modestobacter excelsi]